MRYDVRSPGGSVVSRRPGGSIDSTPLVSLGRREESSSSSSPGDASFLAISIFPLLEVSPNLLELDTKSSDDSSWKELGGSSSSLISSTLPGGVLAINERADVASSSPSSSPTRAAAVGGAFSAEPVEGASKGDRLALVYGVGFLFDMLLLLLFCYSFRLDYLLLFVSEKVCGVVKLSCMCTI